MKQIIAFAKIKNKDSEWEEDFEVSSKAAAKGEIQNVITSYNNTLRKGETERSLVKVLRYEEKELEEVDNTPNPWNEDEDDWMGEDDIDLYDFEDDEEYYD
jgi:hypothetical protein